MRLLASLMITALLVFASIDVSHAQTDVLIRQAVDHHVQALLQPDGVGGVAVVIRAKSQTFFFNYGLADVATGRPVTSESIFNLASVGKVFATTLLAQAVESGELNLDDPVANYVTDLKKGAD